MTLQDGSSDDGVAGKALRHAALQSKAKPSPALSSVGDMGDKSLLIIQPVGLVQSQRGDGQRAAPKKASTSNHQQQRITPCCPGHIQLVGEHGSGMTLIPRGTQ